MARQVRKSCTDQYLTVSKQSMYLSRILHSCKNESVTSNLTFRRAQGGIAKWPTSLKMEGLSLEMRKIKVERQFNWKSSGCLATLGMSELLLKATDVKALKSCFCRKQDR